MKRHLWAILLILFTSVGLSLPLLKPGLYTIHDDQQIARLYLFDQSLRTGQFPVRWVGGLGFGYGYPLFVFYPPFVYWLGELFHLVGFGFIDSVKLVFFASIWLSGIAMYIFVKELWGKLPAVVAAFFYMLVPYRALDIYVRGALAESFSFVWLPLIIWSFCKLTQTQKSIYVYLSAIFLALLMITHNLIFLPFMLFLPFVFLFLVLNVPDEKSLHLTIKLLARRSLGVVGSIVIALGLSAFFWLPALLEKKYTIVDQLLLVNLANYNIHFVYPSQLWNWPWGFAGSAAGLADGISFKIGKLHVLVSISAFIFAIGYLTNLRKILKFQVSSFQFPVIFFSLLILSAFMTTFYSKAIWDLISPLSYLQFPWRFLTFTALFSSVLAGSLVYLLRLPILKMVGVGILMILLVVPNFKLFKPQSYRTDLTDKKATLPETINWYVSSSSFEYLPRGIELYKGSLGTNLVNLDKNQIPKNKIEVISGVAQIKNLIQIPNKIEFTIIAKTQSKIRANVFNFPGWQARVDDSLVSIDDDNSLKLINLDVPQGTHKFKIEFTNTLVRTLGNLMTLGTIIIVALFILLRLTWRNRRA